ncbi:MAG: DUF1826 domain-containing protein [Candidatus Methylacidiphilales bacterium]|nr:DUF1826 domain-containing protein [Candidatus Methylacidiphilales bacterium]
MLVVEESREIAAAVRFRSRAIRMVDSPAELIDIFDPEVQVLVWRRKAARFAAYCSASPPAGSSFGTGFRKVFRAGESLGNELSEAFSGRPTIAPDVLCLAELYAVLLGCEAIGLRYEVVDGAMCPGFHVDRTGIRLLCTYRGPGTQWIDDCHADRSKLGPGSGGLPDHLSGLFGPGTQVQEAAVGDVVLLKGSLWQGNAGRGAIHRSPAVDPDQAPRILVAMDAVWI